MSDYPSDLDCPTSDDAAGVGVASIILLICLGSCANMSAKHVESTKEPTSQVQRCVAHHNSKPLQPALRKYVTLVR